MKALIDFLFSAPVLRFFGKLISRLFKRERNRFTQALVRIGRVHSDLVEFAQRHGAMRIVLLKAHNGGGLPKLGSPLYATVVFEHVDGVDVEPVLDNWQKRQVDYHYVETLCELVQNKVMIVSPESVKGLLRTIYISASVGSSLLCHVGEIDENYYYISCNFAHDVEMTPQLRGEALDLIHRSSERIRKSVSD